MKTEDQSGVGFLLLGLGLGFLAGMLYAPRRGRDVRGQMYSGAASQWSALTAEPSKLRSEARRWLEMIRDRLSCRANGAAKKHPGSENFL